MADDSEASSSAAPRRESRWYELTYHNMYFAVEKQESLSGRTIPNTHYSINNIYLNGVRLAAMEESGAARYFLTDQVDSVKLVADDSGNAVSRIEYLPYGEVWFSEGSEDFAPKYNSQELDKESDLYYFNARHYDPELARFVSADVMVDGEDTAFGWNRYMYVAGNPIMYKDPTGHLKLEKQSRETPFTDSQHTGFKETKTFAIIDEEDQKKGRGLSQIAEQINKQRGVKNTKESVEATMDLLRKNNPDKLEGDNPILKKEDKLLVDTKREDEQNIFDIMPTTGSIVLKILKFIVKPIVEKAIEKYNSKDNKENSSEKPPKEESKE